MILSRKSCGRLPSIFPLAFSFFGLVSNDSSPHLDLAIRQYVLDLCRILYIEKTSYMVTLKVPKKKKRFACHNLGKVHSSARLWLISRAILSCAGSIPVTSLPNGQLSHLRSLRQWRRRHSNSRS